MFEMSSRKPLFGANFSLMLMGAAAAVFSQQAHAVVLLDAPQGGGSYYGMYCNSCVAASFTLTASYYVSTIDVVLRTPTTTSFTTFDFSLQNSLTNPTNTFVTAALTAPLGGVSTKTMNVNKTLLAGTYYLVGNVPGYAGTPITPGDVDGWMLSTGVYNNAAGTINTLRSGPSPAFTVNGGPAGPTTTMSLSRAALNFGVSSSLMTDPQSITVSFSGGTGVSWTVSSNQPNIMVSPSSGTGNGSFQVTVNNPIAWTLQNAVFNDGGRASGFFVFDANTNTVSNWDFVTAGGNTSIFFPFEFTPANSRFSDFAFQQVGAFEFGSMQLFPDPFVPYPEELYLAFSPVFPLTNAGGIVNIDLTKWGECFNCVPSRRFTSGSLQGTATAGSSGVITVTAAGVTNSPLQLQVNIANVAPASPYGSFDTPVNNATGIAGAIAVTGWALDNIEVSKVDIWRERVGSEPGASNGLVYIGDAVFVDGARPDVETAYPNAPFNYRAGWGYLMLTNGLPNNGGSPGPGNGTYKIARHRPQQGGRCGGLRHTHHHSG